MAGENNITFKYHMVGSTDAPMKIHIDRLLNVHYSPWDPLYTAETTRDYSCEGKISQIDILTDDISHEVPGNVTFADLWEFGNLSYEDLVTLLPTVNSKMNVYTVELGHDNSNNYCNICCDLTYTADHTTYRRYDYRVYLYLGNRESSTHLERELYGGNQNLLQDPSQVHCLKFALPFIYLPGRDADISKAVLGIFISVDVATMTHDSYTFQRHNATAVRAIYQTYQYYTTPGYYAYSCTAIDMEKLLEELLMEVTLEYDSEEAGEPSEPGGYHAGDAGDPGNFDDSSDTVSVPSLPSIGVSNVGFVNVYKVTTGGLVNMGKELFPALQYTQPAQISGTDVVDALINGFNAIMTFMANVPSFFDQINAATFINYILDCHIIPVSPTGGTSEAIKVGSKTLNSVGDKLASDYIEVDCGTLSLREYYANFADFLTSFKLYLPFVGMVSSRPEWFYRESLQVVYHFNIVDGSFMAYILSTGAYVNNNNSGKTIVGQYGGNCCVHIPITGVTYSSMVSGLVGAGSGAVMAAGSGNIPALTTSAIAAAAAHGDIAQSNAYASSVAFLGCRRPFAVIERPVSSFSEKYAIEKGIPSNVARKLGNVTGFSMIGDVHLDGIDATEAEKLEIERLLHEGVIL